MKKLNLRNRTLLGCAAALFLVACSEEVPSDKIPEGTAQEPAVEAPKVETPRAVASPEGRHGMRGPGGPAFLLRAALDKLELRPEQKSTIEGLMAELKQARPMDSAAHRAFEQALASGVRAGKLDAATLAPHFTALERDATAMSQRVHTALNKLHQTLDADQRKQLVAEIQKRHEMGFGKHAGRRMGFGPPPGMDEPGCAPGADGADNEAGEDGAEARPRRGHGGPGFARHAGPGLGMLRDLELTDAQKTALRAAHDAKREERGDWKAGMEKHQEARKALLTAFATDTFDATKLVASAEVAERAHRQAEGHVEQLRVLMGVLEPAQREKLAARVEQGPPRDKP